MAMVMLGEENKKLKKIYIRAISHNVMRLRVSKFWSMRELSRRAGVGHVTIHYIENGKTLPTDFTLNAIADALNVSVAELKGEKPSSFVKNKKCN